LPALRNRPGRQFPLLTLKREDRKLDTAGAPVAEVDLGREQRLGLEGRLGLGRFLAIICTLFEPNRRAEAHKRLNRLKT
jgi:hypothetical protein